MVKPMNDIAARIKSIRGLTALAETLPSTDNIQKLIKGGYLDIKGETYEVVAVSKYLDVKWETFGRRKSDYWVHELELVHCLSGKRLFIEWEVDDELEISESLSQLKLRDILYNDKPINRQALEDIAEEESGQIKVAGTLFHYSEDETWAALYYPESQGEALAVRMYEFESDSDKCVTIELWEDEGSKPEREAFMSTALSSSVVNILQIGPSNT